MSKIVVFLSLTLDGIMQAPGRPDEDRRGHFEHGGWAAPYADPVMGTVAAESMASTGALLFGRRTYQDFYSVWPNRTDNPFTEVLNNTQKYVASTTLEEPLPWSNSTLLKGDAARAVAGLKRKPGKDIVILGSGQLVRSLMRHDLVDTYVLQIHPLVLGTGRRLFEEGGPMTILRLVDAKTTTTGVVIATYSKAPLESRSTTKRQIKEQAKRSTGNSIDEYIAGFPPETQKALEQLRALIKTSVPDAIEKISYAMPTFDLNGKHLVHFAGYGKHIGFYPVPSGIEAFKEELKPYKTGKGSAQFPLGRPLPTDLIRRIVEFRVQENTDKAASGASTPGPRTQAVERAGAS